MRVVGESVAFVVPRLSRPRRGWRDANRTAAGTAALQRRFPQRLQRL